MISLHSPYRIIITSRLLNIALLLLFVGSTQLFSQWERIDLPFSDRWGDIHFATKDVGWIVGDASGILKTTDGGMTWEKQFYSDTTVTLAGVYAQSEQICWAISIFDSLLVRTTDGGTTWERQFFNIDFGSRRWAPSQILFLDSLHGWISGGGPDTGAVLYTNNGGETWQKFTTPNGCYSLAVDAIDTQHVWLSCINSLIYSADGMKTWRQGGHLREGEFIEDLDFHTPSLGYLTGTMDPGMVFVGRTDDSGKTARFSKMIGLALGSSFISFIDSARGWYGVANYITDQTEIYFTRDGGTSWEEQLSYPLNPGFPSPLRLFMLDSLHGWLLNMKGVLFRTTNGGGEVTSIPSPTVSTRPNEFILEQNYPNPFNPLTVIRYELPVTSDVSLKIFNLLGEEVSTLVHERKEPGSYSVQWDGSRYPSGVYFYRLQAGTFTETRKLLLVR